MSDADHRQTEVPRSTSMLAFLVRAYLFVAVLAAAGNLAPTLNAGWLLGSAMILAVPAALALWHRAVVRTLLSLHQFQPGHALHWIASRLVLRKIIGAVIALLVTLSSIVHASLFGPRDWLLLALMPAVFAAACVGLERLLRPQLTAAYLSHATLRLAGWAVALAFWLAWVGLAVAAPDAAPGGLLERVDALQGSWKDAPAASARYAADVMAWAAAALESASAVSQAPWWRFALGAVIAPLATVVFVALAMQGLALPAAEVRRSFSPGPSEVNAPLPVTPLGAGTYAAVIVVFVMILFQMAAHVEHALGVGDSPFAVRRLPKCEAIDGKVYKLGTLDWIRREVTTAMAAAEPARASACANLDSAQAAAGKPIDAYLDWYFSLPAEWMRIGAMLAGDPEKMLSDHLAQALESEPGLAEALAQVQSGATMRAHALDALQAKVHSILGDNELVLDEGACRVARRDSITQALAARESESLRLRTLGSAGAGLAAGVVAAKVAAKAITKASMKTAAKVLAKFAGKKAAAMGLSTGVGAMAGSVVPGVGTALGAAIGMAAGAVITVGVDWAALVAEERLERDTMKAELLEALRETLAPAREAMACAP